MKKIFSLFLLIMLFFLNSNVFAVEVSAPHAILIDMDTGKTLFEKDAYSAVYPASTTKVLTAILVLEEFAELVFYIALVGFIYLYSQDKKFIK